MKQSFFEKNTQMTIKDMERCSTSPATREMQSKTTVSDNHPPVGSAKTKQGCHQECKETGLSLTLLKMWNCTASLEYSLAVSYETRRYLWYHSAAAFLGIYPKEMET